jgi:hypothetical protein
VPARQSRNQSNKSYFIAETRSSQRSEYCLIDNSLLCALSASAVSSLLDQPDQDLLQPPSLARAASEIATTAGCFSFRSSEIA